MPTLIVTKRNGETVELEGKAGLSVMEVIRDNGFDELLALCGGCCACATCHVYIQEESLALLTPMEADEDELLDTSDFRRANSRLACQVPFEAGLDGLRVVIAPE